jgi:competence protein ComEC
MKRVNIIFGNDFNRCFKNENRQFGRMRTPMLRLFIFFALGILTAIYSNCSSPYYPAALFAVSCAMLVFPIRSNYRVLVVVPVFYFAGSAFGVFWLIPERTHYTRHQDDCTMVRIADIPVDRNGRWRCEAVALAGTNDSIWFNRSGRMMLYLDSSIHPLLDDTLIVRTQFKPPRKPDIPFGFDYGLYLKRKGIACMSFIKQDDVVQHIHARGKALQSLPLHWREALLQKIRPHAPDREFGVLSALILGKATEIDEDVSKDYMSAGAVHILAVSGMHVGLIYAALLPVMSFFWRGKKGKWFKFLIPLILLWLFAAITGASASVMRAAVMFSLFLFATHFQQTRNSWNTIAASAFLLCIYRPTMLLDAGFQLSYAAIAGIVAFQKSIHAGLVNGLSRLNLNQTNRATQGKIQRDISFSTSNGWRFRILNRMMSIRIFKFLLHCILSFNNFLLRILRPSPQIRIYIAHQLISLTAASIAAQITTLPFSLYYFHQFPNYFLLCNLIAIPVSTVLLYTGLLWLILYPLPAISSILANVTLSLTTVLNSIVSYTARLPHSVTSGIYVSLPMAWATAVFSISIFCVFLLRSKKMIWPALFSLVCMLALHGVYRWNTSSHAMLSISSFKKKPVIALWNGQQFSMIIEKEAKAECEKIAQRMQPMMDYCSGGELHEVSEVELHDWNRMHLVKDGDSIAFLLVGHQAQKPPSAENLNQDEWKKNWRNTSKVLVLPHLSNAWRHYIEEEFSDVPVHNIKDSAFYLIIPIDELNRQ